MNIIGEVDLMNNMAVCNYIVSVMGTLIGGSIMLAASEFQLEFTVHGPGPGFWPFSLGLLMLAAAIVLFGYTLFHKEELSQRHVSLTTEANKRVYIMMGLVVAFCVLINLLGFYLAAACLIPAVMKLMDYHNKKYIALTTIGTIVFIYLVFGMLLHTNMPESIFLE